MSVRPDIFSSRFLVELLLIAAVSTWGVQTGITALVPSEQVVQIILVTLTFWGAVVWSHVTVGTWNAILIGSGSVVLMEALISYYGSVPLQIQDIGIICLAGSILIMLVRLPVLLEQRREVTMLVGFERLGENLIHGMRAKLLGVVAPRGTVPEGVNLLGSSSGVVTEAVAGAPVKQIVVDTPDWSQYISPRQLLEYKLQGIAVKSSREALDDIRSIVDVESLGSHALWTGKFRPNVRMLVTQAVYSNLLGLALLLLTAPLLLVLGIASRWAAGPGTMFERIECAGFQGIPFVQQRFRIRNAAGQMTSPGRLIETLHLVNLPQLLNVVRGEMCLFGPQAVRMEFSLHLDTLASMYSMRLSTRPGILGWAQANEKRGVPEEHERLGYDLYYLKHVSPVMDLDIFMQSGIRLGQRLFRRR